MSLEEKGGVFSQQKASIIELNVSNRGQNKGLLDYLGGVLYRCSKWVEVEGFEQKWVEVHLM